MDTIELIVADSSDIYEFSSKQVDTLDSTWDGSWNISTELGGENIVSGSLVKNATIYNEDSLINEDFRKTFKVFEPTDIEIVTFNEDVIIGDIATISGTCTYESTDNDGNKIELPLADKYLYITIKGVFVTHSRTERVKTDINGEFSTNFNINNTVKTEANSFFIFQLLPGDSELLEVGTYYLSVEVRQTIDDQLVFRKEVMQNKIKTLKQGVLGV